MLINQATWCFSQKIIKHLYISSFMQNKISKIIMLTIPIIESLILASIAFLGWFLEELPVRFIPTCSFLLYKQSIRYAALAVALSLFNAESIWYWYITLLSLDTILPFKRWYKHEVFWYRLGCKLWKLLVWKNIHNYEKSKKHSDLQIIAGAKVTTFAYGIMLPSIFKNTEDVQIILNHFQ